jgi:hypothetical protein
MTIVIPIPNQELVFRLYPIDTKFNRISGIYTFFILSPNHTTEDKPIPIGESGTSFYNLLYVGIATNIYSRLKSHHKLKKALTLGMTHLGILKMSSGRKRKTTEKKLLKNYNPALNQTWL